MFPTLAAFGGGWFRWWENGILKINGCEWQIFTGGRREEETGCVGDTRIDTVLLCVSLNDLVWRSGLMGLC